MGNSSSSPPPPPQPPKPTPEQLKEKMYNDYQNAVTNYKKWRDKHWKLFVKYNNKYIDENWFKNKENEDNNDFFNFYNGLVSKQKNITECNKELLKYQELSIGIYDSIIKVYQDKLIALQQDNTENNSDINTLNRDIAYDMEEISRIGKTEKTLAFLTLGLFGTVIFLVIFKQLVLNGKMPIKAAIFPSLFTSILLSILIRYIIINILPSVYNISKLKSPTGNIENIRLKL